MADIDMMPRSYREGTQAKRLLGRAAAVLGAMAVAGMVTHGLLKWQLDREQSRLVQLRVSAAQSDALRKQIDVLIGQKTRLEQWTTALSALRGLGEITRAAHAIDNALLDGIWFTSLTFSRNEQAVDTTQDDGRNRAVQTGYFIVVPAGALAAAAQSNQPSQSGTGQQTWKLSKHLEMRGEALDHAALTDFMKRLSSQPGIVDVRFLSSNVHTEGTQPLLDFRVDASLFQAGKAAP